MRGRFDAPPVDALRRPARQRLAEPRRPRGRGSPFETLLELVGRRRAARGGGEALWRFVKPGPEDVAAYTTELLTATQTTRTPPSHWTFRRVGRRGTSLA